MPPRGPPGAGVGLPPAPEAPLGEEMVQALKLFQSVMTPEDFSKYEKKLVVPPRKEEGVKLREQECETVSKLCGLWFRRLRSLRIHPSCHPSQHLGSPLPTEGDTMGPTQGNVPDVLHIVLNTPLDTDSDMEDDVEVQTVKDIARALANGLDELVEHCHSDVVNSLMKFLPVTASKSQEYLSSSAAGYVAFESCG